MQRQPENSMAAGAASVTESTFGARIAATANPCNLTAALPASLGWGSEGLPRHSARHRHAACARCRGLNTLLNCL